MDEWTGGLLSENMPSVTNQILNIDTALKVLCEKYSGKEWPEALEARAVFCIHTTIYALK